MDFVLKRQIWLENVCGACVSDVSYTNNKNNLFLRHFLNLRKIFLSEYFGAMFTETNLLIKMALRTYL